MSAWSERSVLCAADCERSGLSTMSSCRFCQVIISNYASYKKFDDCMIRYGMLSDNAGLIIIHAMRTESLNKTKSTKSDGSDHHEFFLKGVKSVAIEL